MAMGHVRDDLRALGASDVLVELAERATRDEYAHSVWCEEWSRRFELGADERDRSGREPWIADSRVVEPRGVEPLRFRGATQEEDRLLRVALCCLTETYGCLVLQQARPHLADASLRQLNQRHMSDELNHSRLGWAFLASLVGARRSCVRDWLPDLLVALEEIVEESSEMDRDDLVPHGYFSRNVLRDAHREAVDGLILPGLKRLNLWRVA